MKLGAALTLCLIAFAQTASALTVTLVDFGQDSTELTSRALSAGGNGQQDLTFEPGALPFSDTHTASRTDVWGQPVTSETSYSLNSSAFDVDIVLHENGGQSSAWSFGTVYFTVDQNVAYEISGSYTMASSWTAETTLDYWLLDLTDSVTLFNNEQYSRSTLNESFELGQVGGDTSNLLVGSLAGTLEDGHLYRLKYNSFIYFSQNTPFNATATGHLNLTFVPEPSTASLLALGLVGIAAVRRRRAN